MNAPRHTEQEQVALRFHAILRPMLTEDLAADLFPSVLAAAAARTIRCDGAGLSLIGEGHRVPVGASDEVSMRIERLQFTIGEGPCLDAMGHGRPVRVDEDQMAAEWGAFHEAVRDDRPFRSVIAVPMLLGSGLRGALDLYFTAATMPPYAALVEAQVLATRIGALIDLAETEAQAGDLTALNWTAGELPDWVYGTAARRRLRVWIAVGILAADLELTPDDALARLRASAYSRDRDLDHLSDDLIEGSVSPRDLDAG